MVLGWPDPVGADQPIGDERTDHADALFDMIDGDALELQREATARIPLQEKPATVPHQRAGFLDPAADKGHRAGIVQRSIGSSM
jgi:hypothetical protein